MVGFKSEGNGLGKSAAFGDFPGHTEADSDPPAKTPPKKTLQITFAYIAL